AAMEFMEYSQPGANDQLQEYFVPVDQFDSFVQRLGAIVKDEEMNLLNVTIRYVNEDRESLLSYAREDMLALVCLFHVPLSKREQQRMGAGIQRIIDEVILHNGTYYLPYIAYPTKEQFQAVYDNQAEFFMKKAEYDPEGVFMNYF